MRMVILGGGVTQPDVSKVATVSKSPLPLEELANLPASPDKGLLEPQRGLHSCGEELDGSDRRESFVEDAWQTILTTSLARVATGMAGRKETHRGGTVERSGSPSLAKRQKTRWLPLLLFSLKPSKVAGAPCKTLQVWPCHLFLHSSGG